MFFWIIVFRCANSFATPTQKSVLGKYNALLSKAQHYQKENLDSAQLYFLKAHALSINETYQFGIIETNNNIASINMDCGKISSCYNGLITNLILSKDLLNSDKSVMNINLYTQTLITLADYYTLEGKYDLAQSLYRYSLYFYDKTNNIEGKAIVLSKSGYAYRLKGNYVNAISLLFQGLKFSKKTTNSDVVIDLYNSIGLVYRVQGNLRISEIYLQKALHLAKINKNFNKQGVVLKSLSTILFDQNKNEEAAYFAEKAMLIGKKINDARMIASSLVGIGDCLASNQKWEESHRVMIECLQYANKTDHKSTKTNCYRILSDTYLHLKNNKQAIRYAEEALKISKELNSTYEVYLSSAYLSRAYQQNKDYEKLCASNQLNYEMQTLLNNVSKEKTILEQDLKYKYENKALSDSLQYISAKQIQQIETQANLKTQRNKQIALSIGLLIALISGAILYNRFKVIQKQKSLIEVQSQSLKLAHIQLEKKSKEINDSISYSKDIQNLFLKSITESKKHLTNTILLYKPKDVVSGDFYWYKEQGDNVFIIVGDCAGHGIPGAIISVLAIQTLEKTITQITTPNELHHLNEFIRNEFNTYYNKNSYVGIGLDYSILCINYKEQKIYSSGSGNTILFKNKLNEIIVRKFESINIGGPMPMSYNPYTYDSSLKDVSSVFLYTDGIVDQKGEVTEKKFGTKKLIELISKLNTNEPDKALQIIENTLTDWQGKTTQIDDMTLLGIQFT